MSAIVIKPKNTPGLVPIWAIAMEKAFVRSSKMDFFSSDNNFFSC
jgi:hypothetical protein